MGVPLSEPIRSHHDIEKETQNVKFMKKAVKHYQAVAMRASKVGHVFDVFACALDQVRAEHNLYRYRSMTIYPST